MLKNDSRKMLKEFLFYKLYFIRVEIWGLVVMVHAFNPSTWQAETGGSL